MSSVLRFFTGLVFAFSLFTGCQQTGPPVIDDIGGDSLVPANDSADYVCYAWDWGLRPIEYDWSCDRGVLGWDSANWVRWHAPESSGPAVIRASVIDEDGLVTTDSQVVEVTEVKTVVIQYWGAVKALEFREWRDSLRIGYEIEGTFSADTGVSFLVLDDSNYQRWLVRQTYQALVSLQNVVRADSFDTVVGRVGWYNLVIDNRSEKRDRTFGLFVLKTTP